MSYTVKINTALADAAMDIREMEAREKKDA